MVWIGIGIRIRTGIGIRIGIRIRTRIGIEIRICIQTCLQTFPDLACLFVCLFVCLRFFLKNMSSGIIFFDIFGFVGHFFVSFCVSGTSFDVFGALGGSRGATHAK